MDEDNSPYRIEIYDEADVPEAEKSRIRSVVFSVLRTEDCPAAEISVALLHTPAVRDLNARYLGRDEETDVLAFDLTDGPEAMSSNDDEQPCTTSQCNRSVGKVPGRVGQVVVNVDLACRQAAKRGITPTSELMLYVVHGCLHLMGYDDLEADEAKTMHRREDELLERLGYGRAYSAAEDLRKNGS
jgi:probable rRNA maturation factor